MVRSRSPPFRYRRTRCAAAPLPCFKTDNVTSMNWMFRNCSNLTNLDVSGDGRVTIADVTAFINIIIGK